MELIHNALMSIMEPQHAGMYRVILDEPALDRTAVVRLDPPKEAEKPMRGGRRRVETPRRQRKKAQPPLTTEILWLNRSELIELGRKQLARNIEIEVLNVPGHGTSERSKINYQNRQKAAATFLNLATLRAGLLAPSGLGGLVHDAIKTSGLSRPMIYKVFSLLCQHGFSERSLSLAHHRCGAPGQLRPCDPGGRQKAGRKTTKQRIVRRDGNIVPSDQPGMSTNWRELILAADRSITSPKPPMPQRIMRIIDSSFISRYRQDPDGKLVPIDLKLGDYPNRRQIRRVLEHEIPKLQRVLEATTKGHYDRALRGLRGYSWQGVAGPGHTWAIDSTVGDIYLRSSINRAWIIGRPIVYIIVDVWSTAIVGFYVCLMGPSWDMAKLALFCAGSDPTLISALWGYQPVLSLDPVPSLPSVLLCDRGEYLSKGAKQTGIELLPSSDYTPPYRPDLKGLVEVLHRIAKDRQFHFIPGAIDARRVEFELRRFNPNTAALTVREFVHFLDVIFTEYNLTANREHRLDAHMRAAGVFPSPAGLWHWGHMAGIGFRRAVSKTDLVTELLPSATARVQRKGIFFAGRHYESEFAEQAQWSARARAFVGWDIPCNYFPGTVSRIWTPKPEDTGLLELQLSDYSTASPELTMDEVADAEAFHKIDAAAREHTSNLDKLSALKKTDEIVATAKRLTEEALAEASGPEPTMTEARALEREAGSTESPPSVANEIAPIDNYDLVYLDTMRELLEGMSNTEGHDE